MIGPSRLPSRPISAAVLGLGLLAGCASPQSRRPPAAADSAGVAFEGSWTASGTRHALDFGGDRRTSVLALSGSAVFTGASRPAAGFRAEAIVLTDDLTGMTGRAVWTDEHGDQVYSELGGGGPGADGTVRGTIVGGTGRFAGAAGEYRFGWQYLVEAEDGTVQGRATGLRGTVRLPVAPRP